MFIPYQKIRSNLPINQIYLPVYILKLACPIAPDNRQKAQLPGMTHFILVPIAVSATSVSRNDDQGKDGWGYEQVSISN